MRTNTCLATISAAVLVVLVSAPAHADFRYDPGADTVSAPSSVTAAPIRPMAPVYSSTGLTPGEGQVIDGFGKQVPLVLALREVVPTDYQFAYAPGINLGTLVDWQGGKPWHDVLNDLLATQSLYASESNQVISIAQR